MNVTKLREYKIGFSSEEEAVKLKRALVKLGENVFDSEGCMFNRGYIVYHKGDNWWVGADDRYRRLCELKLLTYTDLVRGTT